MPDIRKTGFLDDFQRPDEDPLSWDGRWKYLFWNGLSNLALGGNVCSSANAFVNSTASSYWSPATFTGDVECWGLTTGSNDLTEGLDLFLHITGTVGQGIDAVNGYRLRWLDPIGDANFTISRFDGGGRTDLHTEIGDLATVEGAMLFRRTGDTLQGYAANSHTDPDFQLVIETSDSTYSTGFLGLGTAQDDDNPGWAGFGGGAIRRTQIYRYVSN